MEEEKRECFLPDIPLDVWNLILLRVPAESLVRFKGVCKAWRGLIDSGRFVESHLEHWRPRPDMILCEGMGDVALVPLHSEPWLSSDCLSNALAEVRTRFGAGAHLRVYNSCDGLILFGVVSSPVLAQQQLLACNPVTKSAVLLPHCSSFRIKDFDWRITCDVGSSQAYNIIGIPSAHDMWLSRLMRCFVFDLRRGGGLEPSSWKELHMDVPRDCFSLLLGPVLSTGRKVQWLIELVHRREESEPVVVSLDLSAERLSHTRIRSDEPTFKGWTQSCWLYSDRVMCWLHGTRFSDDLELWVLEDLDSDPVWRMRHKLKRPPEGSKYRTLRTGIYMEAEDKIAIDDGFVYSASSRSWSKITDFDSAQHLRQISCPHVNTLVKFD